MRTNTRPGLLGLTVLALACSPGAQDIEPVMPNILATNAFYYYEDVESAWAFLIVSFGSTSARNQVRGHTGIYIDLI